MAAPALRKYRVDNFERVSTDRQETERQRFDLQDNVEQFNLEVSNTPVRLKISGTKVRTSPEWTRMIGRMKSPERDGINISALDRLFRPEDFAIIAEALEVFREYKKVIVSTKEGLIEPWTPRGWQICMEAVLQAGKELAELKRRTAGGRRKAHANHKPMNTEPCFGILYRDKYSRDAAGECQYFYEDPEPASTGRPRREIVDMIFQWRYVERLKIYRIVKRLNGLSILTGGKRKKDGSWQWAPGMWTRSTVIQLLQNRKYIGEHWEGGHKVDCACPQFISREIFAAVQASFLVEKDPDDKQGRDSDTALLHTYLVCDRCKHRMNYHQRPNQKHVYRCMHVNYKTYKRACTMGQIQARIIEPVVFLAIWRHLTEPELLLENARAYYESLPARPAAAALEAELADVMARIERTAAMVRLGTYNFDKGNAEILDDQKRMAEIQAELRTAGAIDLPAAHVIEGACRRIAQGKMPSTFDTQRPVLEKLLDLKVYYDGQSATITGKVPVPAGAAGEGRKCKGRVNGDYTSTLFIPFKIQERVA
jgi:DNA invertase Pin-like site-specific DNA recombinase